MGKRSRICEIIHLDTVGYYLIPVGKVTADEFACRLGYGDAPVQLAVVGHGKSLATYHVEASAFVSVKSTYIE